MPGAGLQSFETTRGGLRDVERAAAYLTVTHAATAPEVIAADTVSVFQSAGEGDLIPDDTAQRLAEAARMWAQPARQSCAYWERMTAWMTLLIRRPGQSLPEVAEQTISMR